MEVACEFIEKFRLKCIEKFQNCLLILFITVIILSSVQITLIISIRSIIDLEYTETSSFSVKKRSAAGGTFRIKALKDPSFWHILVHFCLIFSIAFINCFCSGIFALKMGKLENSESFKRLI